MAKRRTRRRKRRKRRRTRKGGHPLERRHRNRLWDQDATDYQKKKKECYDEHLYVAGMKSYNLKSLRRLNSLHKLDVFNKNNLKAYEQCKGIVKKAYNDAKYAHKYAKKGRDKSSYKEEAAEQGVEMQKRDSILDYRPRPFWDL